MAQQTNKQSKADNAIALANDDDREWAERCVYWSAFANEWPKQSKGKRFVKEPLFLTGNGVSLSIDRGTLLIRRPIGVAIR